MTRIRIQGSLKTLLAKLPLWKLLGIWTLSYAGTGLAFAAIFMVNRRWLTNCHHTSSVIYFSFTTLATIGYGDILPTAWNRLFASLEAFVGVGLNSILLGLVVTVFLRRSSPILFPDKLVFDVEDTTFWFRSVNSFDVTLINPRFDISLAVPAPSSAQHRNRYDIVGGYLKLPYYSLPVIPPMELVATRSERLAPINGGPKDIPDKVTPLTFPEKDLIPSPLHLVSTTGDLRSQPAFRVVITGHFADTGQVFVAEKIYRADAVQCGSYRNFENFKYHGWPLPELAQEVDLYFNVVESTTNEFCTNECALHLKCPLDVAVRARATLARRSPATRQNKVDPNADAAPGLTMH